MVGRVLKIIAFSLFGIAVVLAGGALVGIGENSEVGGWLLFAAGVTVIVAGLFAFFAIILGGGSTAEKAGKFFLLSSPFLTAIVILGALILIGGALLMLWIYVAGSMFK